MIKIEKVETYGWEAAVRGMRNPLNSWSRSDSEFLDILSVGPNDYDLMKRLRKSGTDHRKFMRMIGVSLDITAPLYWWKEYDTYKVGTVANSCSTMHKIQAKEFILDDFSHERLSRLGIKYLNTTINALNFFRNAYNAKTDYERANIIGGNSLWTDTYIPTKEECWWQMIQLLPTSYNQKRTVMLNYEVLANIYKSRKNHKLDEWRIFCEWIETLPYSSLITGGNHSNDAEKSKE